MATQVIFSVEEVNTLIQSTPENLGNIVISPTLPSDVYVEIVRRIEDSGLNYRLVNPRARGSTSPPVDIVTVSTLEDIQRLSTRLEQIVLVRIPRDVDFELAAQLAVLAFQKGFVVVEGYGSVLSAAQPAHGAARPAHGAAQPAQGLLRHITSVLRAGASALFLVLVGKIMIS